MARINDVTERPRIWRRFEGDDWAAFDALPPAVRRRLHEHAYDAWSVNALILWRIFRRQTASSRQGEKRLLNHLRICERLELEAFADAYGRQCGGTLPHVAAGASTLRYEAGSRASSDQTESSGRIKMLENNG